MTTRDEARERLARARDAYVSVMQNWQTRGDTEAERRFSDGEARETAEEAMFEELAELTFEHVSALLSPEGDGSEGRGDAPSLRESLTASEVLTGQQIDWLNAAKGYELRAEVIRHEAGVANQKIAEMLTRGDNGAARGYQQLVDAKLDHVEVLLGNAAQARGFAFPGNREDGSSPKTTDKGGE